MNTTEDLELDLMIPAIQLMELQGDPDGIPFYPDDERFDISGLIRFVTLICGISPLEKTRKVPAVTGRMIVAYRLSREGYGSGKIGKIIHKSHCIICYYVDKMEFIIGHPSMYADVMRIWNKVIKEYPL